MWYNYIKKMIIFPRNSSKLTKQIYSCVSVTKRNDGFYMKQKNKRRKRLAFVLAVTLLLCASFVFPVCAHDGHLHIGEGITFFFTDEFGNVSTVMPLADNCCSNPRITDYKRSHRDSGFGYCYTDIVQVCSNCGHITESTATSIGGCTWWCDLPQYYG